MKKIILTLLILIIPHSALAYSELIGLFIDDGVKAMSRGGIEKLFQHPETADFDSPLSINSRGKYRFDTGYEYQRTARVFDGSWSGSHAYSEALQSTLSAPYSFFDGNLTGSLAAGYGYKSVDIKAQSFKEDISVSSDSSYKQPNGGLFLSVMNKASFGMAFIDTSFRNSPETPIELEISPIESLRFGYKRSYRDFPYDFNLAISGKSGVVPFDFRNDSEELYVEGRYTDILTLRYTEELKRAGNSKLAGRLKLPGGSYLAGNFSKRKFNMNQEFSVEGLPGGYLRGEFMLEESRVGFGIDLAKWNLEANFRRQRFNSDGGGIAETVAAIGFWPSLFAGRANYLYHAGFKSDTYHLAGEYRGEHFTLATGCQYIDLRPEATIEYWSGFWGLGRIVDGSWELTKDRVKLLFVSLGIGYKWDNVSLQYAFGQFIPVSIHDSKPESPSEGGGGGGAPSSEQPSMLTHNPGGNIQRILLSIVF